MADYNAYSDLAQRIAGGLIVTDINELVQFVADKSSLRMLQLIGGVVPSGQPGVGFKTRAPLIKKRGIYGYEHKWIKQAVAEKDVVMNGAKTTETALILTSATYPRVSEGGIYQAEHPDTGAFLEVLQVYEDTGSSYTVNVRRNLGSTSNASLPDGTILRRRSHVVSDRSTAQKIHDIDPTTSSNLTETIRIDWEQTWKGEAQKEYGSLNSPEVIKRRKLYEFAKYMNWAMLYGKGGTTTDKNGKRVQFMTGLTGLMTSNLYSATSPSGYTTGHGGELTLDKYRNICLRRIARLLPDDVNDVVVLHGDLLERAMDFWFEEKISNFKQTETFLGWELTTIKVAGKNFHHMYDAIVDEQDTGSAIIFPINALTYCYTDNNGINLDVKHYEIDFKSQGITSNGGFFLCDITLEIGWEQGMGYMSGVTAYA